MLMVWSAYLVKLPSRLVITPIVDKFAGVSISTEACLLIVFADVWLVVKAYSHPHITGCSQGPMKTCAES